jgi:hypothetical protein
MIYEVCSVYDEKAEAFLPPFILPKVAQAKRVFADCVNSDDHQFGQNPADYTLFRLGQFDDASGQYLLERAKQSLGNGVEFRAPDQPISPEIKANGKKPSIAQVPDEPPVQSGSASENPTE